MMQVLKLTDVLKQRFAVTMLLAAVLALAGCQSQVRHDPAYAPVAPATPAPEVRQTGAIYNAQTSVRLFEDLTARRVGDILTIVLQESTDASKTSATTIAKSQSTSISEPTIFGTNAEFSLPGIVPLAQRKQLGLETELESSSDFSGDSDSSQSNSLSGEVTVTVVEVLTNGNLRVRGEKRLNLNQGNEYVKIAGIVRPVDIAANNTVPSNRVADATIVYSGDGSTASANVMGWLAKFFISALMPF